MNKTSLSLEPIVQLQRGRVLSLAVYVAIGVMGLLGMRGLEGSAARTVAAGLCIAIALLHALLFPRAKSVRIALWYFALQTALVTILLLLSPVPNEFFGFLFYILAILAAITFPAYPALGWTALFFAISVVANGDLLGTPRLTLIVFVAVVLLFSGFLGSSLRAAELARRQNQALMEEMAATQRRLQELALAEERNRMAREIHDGLGHYLTATTMQVQGARAVLERDGMAGQAPAVLDALGKAETLLQEALADVRRSVAALRVSSEDKPLAARIGELVENSRTPGGLETQFVLAGRPRRLAPQAELTLYRAVQEGLTNVRKHAQAHRVEVTLAYAEAEVRLTVADDGLGGQEEQEEPRTNGFGLLGLQERVQLLGGALHVERTPGQGFQLTVEIPA